MKICICWLRRDLREDDQSAFYHALRSGLPVLPVFIFDTELISGLPQDDKRLIFIYESVRKLKLSFESRGSTLLTLHGEPTAVFGDLLSRYPVEAIHAGIDYEPYSIARDRRVKALCADRGVQFHEYHDHVVFPPDEVLKADGTPYHVFTPYCRSWLQKFEAETPRQYPCENLLSNLMEHTAVDFPASLPTGSWNGLNTFPPKQPDPRIIADYHLNRDFPGLDATSHLGIHLRFGTLSIRKLVRLAAETNRTYLNELIWREFYQMILYHHPEVVTRSFRPGYDRLRWLNRVEDFEAWCDGRTGYPLVDAGMRQLTQTGFMHNRVRMVTASFLTKHLLIDWRWGEAFFARYLLDYELASNNGGWQWAAGCGCDAVPYFRVFSPLRQQERYDPDETYVRRWLPEYSTPGSYLEPIIDHSFARSRAIEFLKGAQKV
jgi:deoxyribodipyrimidine photo-lyase